MIAKNKVIVVDVDGTLCPIKAEGANYRDLPVFPDMKQRLVDLKASGWRIILSSSRGMRTYEGNQGEIQRHVLPAMLDWLSEHEIPFDEIWMGKPWPGRDGFYVDDRTVRPREFVSLSLEALDALCERDRLV